MMVAIGSRWLVGIAAFVLSLGSLTVAADETEIGEKILKSCEAFVAEKVRGGTSTGRLKTMTVMKFFNAERVVGETPVVDGALLLCLDEGRPVASMSVYPWDGNICHELDVLTENPNFRINFDAGPTWEPAQSNLTFHVADVPFRPGVNRTLRLSQMKQLARRCTGVLEGFNDGNSDRQVLRLLPKPIFRFGDSKVKTEGEAVDGAIFVFAQGNDPEILMIIEATLASGQPTWRYAFARASSARLSAAFDGETVWAAKKFPDDSVPSGAHFTVRQAIDSID